MKTTQLAQNIDIEGFRALLGQYEKTLARVNDQKKAGSDLLSIDKQRFEEIPRRLQERQGKSQETWLEKIEVETLIKWKLSHGKFRPRLTQLVASNSSSDIVSLTKRVFSHIQVKDPKSTITCVKELSSLSGIGPASASLLLSVFDTHNLPFFSDELFRWIIFDESVKGGGWNRKIKYDLKDYQLLLEHVHNLQSRFHGDSETDVPATDIEKVAYVLRKQASNLSLEPDHKPTKTSVERTSSPRREKRKTPPSELILSPEGGEKSRRRSSRLLR